MVIIGIDAHTQTHTAGAVDEHGRPLGTLEVGASPRELERLIGRGARPSTVRASSPSTARGGSACP